MSDTNKVFELNDKELEQVSGGVLPVSSRRALGLSGGELDILNS